MQVKSDKKLLFRILGRLLLAGNILIMIILRNVFPLTNQNQYVSMRKWIRMFYTLYGSQIDTYLSPHTFMQNYQYLVYAYQMFDFVLILLIIAGTKIGPILYMIQILLISGLSLLVQPSIHDRLIGNVSEYSMSFFRQVGVIGTCLALT